MLPRRLPLRFALAASLTLCAGLGVTALLFVGVSHLEYDKMTLAFQQRANLRVAAVHQGLDEAVEVLTVTNQLFSSVAPVTRAQFHDFTTPLLARHPFIEAFNYHRIVAPEQRAGVKLALRQIASGGAPTSDAANQSGAIAAPLYSFIDYLEPMQDNSDAFGLNLSGDRQIGAALARAVAQGHPAATELLNLGSERQTRRGFEVIMPVYRPGAPLGSADEREAALMGDTAAIIHAGELVQLILERGGLLSDPSIHLSVFASAVPDPARHVFGGADAPSAPLAPGLSGALARWLSFDYPDQFARTLDVAGQPWHVRVTLTPRALLADHLGSLSTLVCGVLFSLLMAAFVHTLVQRSRRVQKLVDQRTADLKHSNRRLIDDVAARARTELALQESEQRFRHLVTMSSDWYWEQDANFRFTLITGGNIAKAGALLGRLIGKTRWETVPGMVSSDWGRAHIELVRRHQPFSALEYTVIDDAGQTRWVSINGEPLYDGAVFKGYRGTGADITARKRSEQRIHHIAHHDVLTGLPNRVMLKDRLHQAIGYAQRSGRPVWVMLIDLDRFKFVNDSMGHKAGDLLLQTVAARLLAALRETDTVARLSGDEFVAILIEQPQECLSVEIVQRVMEAVARPVLLDGKEFQVTCSIGVAALPPGGDASHPLIEHADIAMYRAKKLGRNNFQFYTPAMNEEALERLRIETALRHALERDEFVLHYQPQVDLNSGQIVGMEALLRWQHPELGMVAPQRFIALAEETGLIVPIGAWVMRNACRQNQAWHDAGLGSLRMAVNLSARQFGSKTLVADIAAVLAETGLRPACLELELTESLFMNDVTLAVELLHSMKALGVNIAIDDFGTGYSSLSYLSGFPIDVLKIDRSFVNEITRDPNDAAIVDSIIALAHNLKLAVIAEGVETNEQLAYLRRHGCDEMQGYLFSAPLPAAQFELLLRRHLADAASLDECLAA